jgi:type I restriction enzyme S subunit
MKIVALGKICDVRDGTHDSPSYVENGYFLLTSKNFSSGKISFAGASKISSEDYEKINKRSKVDIGDIVMPMIGTIGSPVRITKEPNFAIKNVALIKQSNQTVSMDYICHFLKSSLFEKQVTTNKRGGTQKFVSLGDLRHLQIPLPPLEEQKRIAVILDQADALRRLRQRSIDRLNSLGQAIFYEMFGDPVSNPMGWPVMKLGEIGNLDRGVSKHRPRNDPKLLGGIYPLIQTGDISNADRYVCTHTSTYSDLGLKQSKLWPAGTLCITIAANIGKTAILGFEACFPDSVVGFSPKDQVNTEYVQYWMDFIQRRLEEVAPQSAQKNINLAILRDLPIPVPPIEQQNKFRDILFEIKEQKTHFGNSEQFYINLFDSLQHKAFKGELSGNIDAECQALREKVSV